MEDRILHTRLVTGHFLHYSRSSLKEMDPFKASLRRLPRASCVHTYISNRVIAPRPYYAEFCYIAVVLQSFCIGF